MAQDDHQLVVHTVVTGGQALLDTLHGAAQLVKQLDAARFVIWLNPFWGPVADNGRSFEQMNVYEAIKKRIETVVSLPAFADELFPQDIASMLKSRLTFREAIESPDHSLMSRHRFKVAQSPTEPSSGQSFPSPAPNADPLSASDPETSAPGLITPSAASDGTINERASGLSNPDSPVMVSNDSSLSVGASPYSLLELARASR